MWPNSTGCLPPPLCSSHTAAWVFLGAPTGPSGGFGRVPLCLDAPHPEIHTATGLPPANPRSPSPGHRGLLRPLYKMHPPPAAPTRASQSHGFGSNLFRFCFLLTPCDVRDLSPPPSEAAARLGQGFGLLSPVPGTVAGTERASATLRFPILWSI